MDYRYGVFYRGLLASRKMTLPGARKLKRQMIKDHGWDEAEIGIKPMPDDSLRPELN